MALSTSWCRSWLASLSLLLLPTAWADCARAVDTVSEGVADTEPKALSRALSEAIAQERGVFVSTRQRLLEYAGTVVQDGRLQERGESSFEEEIRTQYAGFIRRYRVLQRSAEAGGVRVRVQASVCLDPVVALFADGPTLAALSRYLPKGWQLVALAERPALPEDYLAAALRSGATYVGVLDSSAAFVSSGGTVAVQLQGSLVLFDLRSLAVAGAVSYGTRGVGASGEQALAQAADRLAQEIARQWTIQFAAATRQVTFRVEGLRRGGSRFTLAETLAAIPGVIRVDSHAYDEPGRTATLVATLDAQADPCAVAQQLARGRVSLRVDSCGGPAVVLTVLRE